MSISRTAGYLIFASILLSGCDKLQQNPDTVIVDLNAVINATGQDKVIQQQIEQADNELNSQLAQLAENLNRQLADEKAKIGDEPTEEQQQQFNQMTLQANQQLQQAQQIARQQSQQNRLMLVQELRQKIRPIAEGIAREMGASVVVESTETLVWFDSKVDITDEVIAEFRASSTHAGETQPTEQKGDGDSVDTQPTR